MKEQFPLLQQKTDIVYLDNAATTQRHREGLNALNEYYEKHNANAHRSTHSLATKTTQLLEDARRVIAKHLNTSPENTVFTKNSTESLNLLAHSLDKENVVLTDLEHHSNILPWRKNNYDIQTANIETQDENVADYVDKDTDIVSLTHMSNVTGRLLDIERIVKEIKQRNKETLILIDGCQAVPHKKIDFEKLGVDAYAWSTHKFYAPYGTGVLHLSNRLRKQLNPFLVGGGTVTNVTQKDQTYTEKNTMYEAGTQNPASIHAAAQTIKALHLQLATIFEHEEKLRQYTKKRLSEENIEYYGHNKEKEYGPVFSLKTKHHPTDIATLLDTDNVCVRTGTHCAQPLLQRIGVKSTLRLSIGAYNTKDDIDTFIQSIKNAKETLS